MIIASLGCPHTLAAEPTDVSPETESTLRFAYSGQIMQGVNINDAQAAIKVWAATIVGDWDFKVSADIGIIDGVPAIIAAMKENRIDAVIVATDEYWETRKHVPIGPLLVGSIDDDFDEEYIVLVNNDSGFTTLADLAGRNLNIWRSLRTCLASQWLEVALWDEGLGSADTFWAERIEIRKLSQVVLPVFFGQADACLVTRRGFKLMSELNPQLGQKLTAIAVSPPLVPSISFFRGDYDSPMLSRIVAMLSDVSSSEAGQQTLTLFQQNNLMQCTPADLEITCALLDRYEAVRNGRTVPSAKDQNSP
ncbi:PhnD/SsuA/transferrin family substrate-binding protein [Synoicihabitans lomoniglobus]|uniref:PhnD/SsuA/transferrin family substrate-binding protein n=2 Tax=Synoicihabitans lomoniglobus TaxID=2909285 RepID=A0AAF0CMG7_9BACT|nr:PhnD/SsuA/transferrin family substrate-binding protein [Opitutaceae bacterium LMO-M01]